MYKYVVALLLCAYTITPEIKCAEEKAQGFFYTIPLKDIRKNDYCYAVASLAIPYLVSLALPEHFAAKPVAIALTAASDIFFEKSPEYVIANATESVSRHMTEILYQPKDRSSTKYAPHIAAGMSKTLVHLVYNNGQAMLYAEAEMVGAVTAVHYDENPYLGQNLAGLALAMARSDKPRIRTYASSSASQANYLLHISARSYNMIKKHEAVRAAQAAAEAAKRANK